MNPHDLKLQRARQHLEELETEIGRWVHEDGYSIRFTPDPEPPSYLVTADLLRPPDDDNSIPLLIGDVLQNARTALDYLAFALAEVGARIRGEPLTDWEVEHSGFPIIGDEDRNGFSGRGPDMFRSATPEKLAAVTPEARTVMQKLQPFYEPAWQYNSLWILNELARIDRHRFLHVAGVRSGNLRLDPGRIRNVKVESLEIFDGPWFPEIEDSAELARVTVHKANPHEKMHMHFLDALEIAFYTPDDLPSIDGDEVVHVLSSCLVLGVMSAFHKLQPHLAAAA